MDENTKSELPEAPMLWEVKNMVRNVATRTHRAMGVGRQRFKMYLGNRRLVRNRSVMLTQEDFIKEFATINKWLFAGACAVWSPDRTKVTTTPDGCYIVVLPNNGGVKILPKGEVPSCFDCVKKVEETPSPMDTFEQGKGAADGREVFKVKDTDGNIIGEVPPVDEKSEKLVDDYFAGKPPEVIKVMDREGNVADVPPELEKEIMGMQDVSMSSKVVEPSLDEQMAADPEFLTRVMEGEKDIEEGNVHTLDEVMEELGHDPYAEPVIVEKDGVKAEFVEGEDVPPHAPPVEDEPTPEPEQSDPTGTDAGEEAPEKAEEPEPEPEPEEEPEPEPKKPAPKKKAPAKKATKRKR